MRWLNYQHFFYFWRVAKRGSVTEACRELRLAQPTISAQLKVFEENLGEQLFRREGRNLRLTDVGEMAYRYADQIFSLGNEFLDVLEGKSAVAPKELKIGISDVLPKVIAYRIIEPSLFDASEATVKCYEDKSEKLLAELAISELDLVIADSPVPPSVKVKAYNHLIGECGVTFLATSTLAKRFKKNFPKSLSGAPMLLPTSEASVRRELERWFDHLEISPRYVGEFQDSALMKIFAQEGKGIMPVPTVVKNDVKRESRLQVVGATEQVREHFYLISVEKRLKNQMVKAIVDRAQSKLFPHQ